MRKRSWSMALLLSFAACGAQAAASCDDAATQSEINQCAQEAYQAADAELNVVYGKLMARLKDDPPRAEKLRAAQRAWLGFRDAECGFVSAGTAGGTAQPLVTGQCLEQQTRRRIDTLQSYMQCEEGDLSCAVPAQ